MFSFARAFSFLNPGLNVGPYEADLLIGETKLPLGPKLHITAAPIRAHDALGRMGFGTQQKVAKFVCHRESQKLCGIYSLLVRPQLDVLIKHASVDTVAAVVSGDGSSEDILAEDLAVVLRDDCQEQPIQLGYRCADRDIGRAVAVDPSHLDARLAENCPSALSCFAQQAIRHPRLVKNHHGDP